MKSERPTTRKVLVDIEKTDEFNRKNKDKFYRMIKEAKNGIREGLKDLQSMFSFYNLSKSDKKDISFLFNTTFNRSLKNSVMYNERDFFDTFIKHYSFFIDSKLPIEILSDLSFRESSGNSKEIKKTRIDRYVLKDVNIKNDFKNYLFKKEDGTTDKELLELYKKQTKKIDDNQTFFLIPTENDNQYNFKVDSTFFDKEKNEFIVERKWFFLYGKEIEKEENYDYTYVQFETTIHLVYCESDEIVSNIKFVDEEKTFNRLEDKFKVERVSQYKKELDVEEKENEGCLNFDNGKTPKKVVILHRDLSKPSQNQLKNAFVEFKEVALKKRSGDEFDKQLYHFLTEEEYAKLLVKNSYQKFFYHEVLTKKNYEECFEINEHVQKPSVHEVFFATVDDSREDSEELLLEKIKSVTKYLKKNADQEFFVDFDLKTEVLDTFEIEKHRYEICLPDNLEAHEDFTVNEKILINVRFFVIDNKTKQQTELFVLPLYIKKERRC